MFGPRVGWAARSLGTGLRAGFCLLGLSTPFASTPLFLVFSGAARVI